MNTQRTLATLESGSVLRYHAATSVKPQTVGHHSHGVAVLCIYLWGDTSKDAYRAKGLGELLQAAILHDAPELFTGDVPFTVKRDNRDIKTLFDMLEQNLFDTKLLPFPQLTEEQHAVLKLADTLDGLIWCLKHEHGSGAVHTRWSEAFKAGVARFQHVLTKDTIERALELSTSLIPNYLFP